jgi:cell division protein FtsL
LFKKISENTEEINNFSDDIKMPGRWSLFAIVFVAALIAVLYVDNVIRTDNILYEIQNINKKTEFFRNENELLKTKLNYLQSPERITKIAEEKLGMMKMENLPEILED